MFTGLVQSLGIIESISAESNSSTMVIKTEGEFLNNSQLGDSICVQGVCLTATKIDGNIFHADVSGETLACTTLGKKQAGQTVNLETALNLSTPLGGHLVTGHVDGVGQVKAIQPAGDYVQITLQAPDDLAKYIARKGSVCIDGVSLTVNAVEKNEFSVMIIPHTQANTTIKEYKSNTNVNLEVDIVARYVERLHTYNN